MNKLPTFIVAFTCIVMSACRSSGTAEKSLWQVYGEYFKRAKYVDLTHTVTPSIPVWPGFGPSKYGQARDPKSNRAYTYERDGFEANRYDLSTDQLGTQLDPPAHWDPYYPAIDELPPTFAIRPLVVVSIVGKVLADPSYHLTVDDLLEWENTNGRIPEGAVVFIRSDWSKAWPSRDLATRRQFPGVKLEALRFLHENRTILFHGHEPLDTDTTPNLEGEAWLLHNGYTQAEGITNLDHVPEKGPLVAIGFPKFKGGLGGYARFIAICPPDWEYGVSVEQAKDAPLPKFDKPLHWDESAGVRVR